MQHRNAAFIWAFSSVSMLISGGNDVQAQARQAIPEIKHPVMFNTPEADQILTALQVFPRDNPWNEDISNRPIQARSKNIIDSIGAEKPLAYNSDMGFILVPPNQKRVDVRITGYPDESDPGPYPLPDNAPVEDWPSNGVSLEAIQAAWARRPARAGG